jgi:hypothetical protein
MRQIDDIAPGFEKTIRFLLGRLDLLRNVTTVTFTDIYLDNIQLQSLMTILRTIAPRLEHVSIPIRCIERSGYDTLFSLLKKSAVQSVSLYTAESAVGDWSSLRKLETFSSYLTLESASIFASATKNLHTLIVHIDEKGDLPLVKELVEANPQILSVNICLPTAANDVISYAFDEYEDDLLQLPLASIGRYGLPISKLLFDSDDVFRVLFSNTLHRLNRDIVDTIFRAVFSTSAHRRRLQALTIAAIRLVHFDSSSPSRSRKVLGICEWLNGVIAEETDPATTSETKFGAIAALEMMKLAMYRPELVMLSEQFWFERFQALMLLSPYVAGELAVAMLQERSSFPVLERCLQDDNFSAKVGLPNNIALYILQHEDIDLREDLRRVLDAHGIYYGQ